MKECDSTTKGLYEEMLASANPQQVEGLSRFFKCGPGEYGYGDKFLGIKVPVTRGIVKACFGSTDFEELERCITSEYHEVRLASLLALIEIFKRARRDSQLQQRCVDFYLAHTSYINNWDLVDLSCYPLLGRWLLKRERSLLYSLVRNGKSIWERRIGIVSTLAFIREGETDDTFSLAEIFLQDTTPLHDLLQKAVGWMLREAGKRNPQRLLFWLEGHASTMPRTMLRYAIEKLPDDQRARLKTLKTAAHNG